MDILWPPKPCLLRAITLIEALRFQRDIEPCSLLMQHPMRPEITKEEFLGQLLQTNPSGLQMEAALVATAVIEQHLPTVWFCRDRNPVTSILSLLFYLARISPQKVLRPQFKKDEFQRLTRASGDIASSPLILAEARRTGWLIRCIPYLATRKAVRLAVFDTPPNPREMRRLASLSRNRGIQCISVSTTLDSPTQHPTPRPP